MMNKINSDLTKQLINYCSKAGIKLCAKCLLRFCEIKNFNIFKKSCIELNETLLKTGLQSVLAEMTAESNCYSCLGLLSDSYCDQLSLNLIQFLNSSKCEHKFSSFQLFISIPVSLILRNELLINKFENSVIHTMNTLNAIQTKTETQIDFQTIFSVKDILRVILINGLENGLKDKRFDSNALFSITLDLTHEESNNECQLFYELSPKTFFPKKCRKSATKSFLNQSSILRALTVIDKAVLNEWAITEPKVNCSVESIKLTNSPIYIAGRYLKFSRTLSQTPWILDGERLMASSVQDVITDQIKQYIQCDQIKFSSSGREDVDVRMLGRGRPFILEVFNPRVTQFDCKQFSQMMSAINSTQTDVFVRDLQIVSKNSIHSDLKEGENEKTKTYRAICCLSRPVTQSDFDLLAKVGELVIQQTTPIRVLHRRTLSVREKHIYKLWAEKVDESDVPEEHRTSIDRIFQLNLLTEAGTYIKEFVHSDFGRTEPNLATILGNCSADILQLDVMEIHIDWPPVVANDVTNDVASDVANDVINELKTV